jgi:hypothetical protein
MHDAFLLYQIRLALDPLPHRHLSQPRVGVALDLRTVGHDREDGSVVFSGDGR